jgi:hypothetical protein
MKQKRTIAEFWSPCSQKLGTNAGAIFDVYRKRLEKPYKHKGKTTFGRNLLYWML